MKFLGKVIEKFGDGEYVQYSIRYEDGDEEKFVKRAFITPIDLSAMRMSQPKWRRLTSNNISSNADSQADDQGSAIMLSSNEDNDIAAAAAFTVVDSSATTSSAAAAGSLMSKKKEEDEKDDGEDGVEVVINHSWQPLQVGTQIMAAPRGLDKWYSGVVTNIRSGKLNLNAIDKNKHNSSKKNSKNKDKNHKQQLQWLYDIHYPLIEAGGKTVQVSSDVIESDVCAGLVAPILQRE
jgi:hypothetical protein